MLFCFGFSTTMKKSTKLLLLSLMLIFPVLIYLFLQAFGENRYDLPVFPEEPVEIDGCGEFYPGYRIDTLRCGTVNVSERMLPLKGANSLLHFPESDKKTQNQEANELRRFLQKADSISFRIVTFAPATDSVFWHNQASVSGEREWLVMTPCADRLREMQDCQLLLPLAEIKASASASRLVLVDREGKLRGFYVPSDKEDVDRLTVEVAILQKVQAEEK